MAMRTLPLISSQACSELLRVVLLLGAMPLWILYLTSLLWYVRVFHTPGLIINFWQIGVPLWRRSVDKQVLAHREEHQEYLRNKGFFN
jgi:hypothetical protein